MRFLTYGPSTLRGTKIEWDTAFKVTETLRRDLHPHDVTKLRVGRLRVPLEVKASVAGGGRLKRTRSTKATSHKKGALVFATHDEVMFLVEAP